MTDIALRKEFLELLKSDRPGRALAVFIKKRPTALAFMEMADKIPAGPVDFHAGSVLAHLARCMNESAGDPLAVWMALCHDAGKLTTPAEILPHHYDHETRGNAVIENWTETLSLPSEYRLSGVMAATLHMKAGVFPRLRPGKKVALLETVSDSPWPTQFWRLINADTKSRLGDALRWLQEINDRAREADVLLDYRILMIKKISSLIFAPRPDALLYGKKSASD